MTTKVQHTEPKIENRSAQQYVGIRTQIPMHKMPEVIPQLIDETQTWLEKKGVSPTDAPLIRYYVIDMENELDIEIGFPVADVLAGDDRVSVSILPAGRYASLIYTDVTKGIEGNSVLIGWAKAQGIEWDAWDTEKGHAFRSRIEIFMDGPDDDPDPATWRTEVAIKIAND
jgi:effector-binding domain-containing protein